LLYSETSVCFEALAEKVPCIYIDTGKGTLGDTMLNNESMKWSVKTPSELIETRNEIMSINLDALKKAGEEAGKYLNKYFHPVTEENLKKFIET
jgi:hypothetical protein